MKLQSKIFLPVVTSLVILGGSMYLLNRQILKETFNTEIEKVLKDKEKSFETLLQDQITFVAQYSNVLANSSTIRTAFVEFESTNNIDSAWALINAELDRIKFGAIQSKIKAPSVNAYVPPGIELFHSLSEKKGDNVLHKKKSLRAALNTKELVSGLEIGRQGIFIKGISPVFERSTFYGVIEAVVPLSIIIDEIQPENYEAYGLVINKLNINKLSSIDAVKNTENYLQEDLLIQKTENLELSALSEIYRKDLGSVQIDFGESYNHLLIPIKDFDNEIVATLVYQMNKNDFNENMDASSYSLFFIGIMIFLVAVLILFLVLNKVIINPIKRVTHALSHLSKGVITKKVDVKGEDEVSEMQEALNVVNIGMQKMSNFAIEIGNEEYNSDFEALSEEDELGNTLIQVRDKLKKVAEQEEIIDLKEKQRNWAVEGHAKFAALLQENEEQINEYTYKILSNLISYLDINQGAFFLLANDKKTLIQSATYAFDRRKFAEKEILVGDGLLGNTAIEGKMVYITDLPQDYVNITSGLGDASPKSLLIVPMLDEGRLVGVYELATFRNLEPFELEFCEKIAENIAQSISRQQVQQQTKELLEQSQQQSEELSAQEEEMRQNLEEMQATQEEMSRKEAEMTGVINALNSSTLLVEFDLEGNIMNANDRILNVFGLDSKDAILGRNHKDFYDSEGYEERAEKLWTALSNRETVSRKAKVNLPNGEIAWLNETYSPVLDENGEIMKVLNISFNITEEVINQQQVAQQNEEMQAQEEEMRQNLEEMQTTQEEMSRNEAEMTGVVNALNSSTLLVEFDLEGNILNANDRILHVFGLSSKDAILGKNHRDLYDSEGYEERAEKLWTALSNRETVTRKAKVILISGKIVWLNETYSPVLDEHGEITKVLNISYDITEEEINDQQVAQQNEEMKAQEEEMRQNLEEMHATQDEMSRKDAEMEALINALNISTFVVEFDLNRNIISVNDRILDVFEIESRNAFVGKNHKDFYESEGYEERANKLWDSILNKETITRKAKVTLPNGREAWLNESYSPILDEKGNVLRVLNISFDITSEIDREKELSAERMKIQTQAEERMKKSLDSMLSSQEEIFKKNERINIRNKSQLEIMNATALVSKTDLKGIIIYANDLFSKTCGYSQKELIGANHNIVRHPDMTKAAFKNVWDTIQAGKIWTGNVKNKAKDGSFYWVYASVGPVFGENGEIVEYIALRFLITDYINDEEMVSAIHKALPDVDKGKSKETKIIKKIPSVTVESEKDVAKLTYNPKLIKELKQDHQIVSKALVEMQELGIASKKGIELLQQSKDALLAHLVKEDEQLYPVLHSMAENDASLKSTLDIFASEMEGITKFVLDFYAKYSGDNIENEEGFKEDVSAFISALTDRVIKEESVIYKQYDKFKGI